MITNLDRSKQAKPSTHLSPKILIIEDDKLYQLIIRKYLTGVGLAVDIVGTGSEGLKRLLSETYEVLIMDNRLPDMTGIICAEKIRNELGLKDDQLAIVLFTGDDSSELKQELVNANIQEVFYKPLSIKELYARIKKYLRMDGVL